MLIALAATVTLAAQMLDHQNCEILVSRDTIFVQFSDNNLPRTAEICIGAGLCAVAEVRDRVAIVDLKAPSASLVTVAYFDLLKTRRYFGCAAVTGENTSWQFGEAFINATITAAGGVLAILAGLIFTSFQAYLAEKKAKKVAYINWIEDFWVRLDRYEHHPEVSLEFGPTPAKSLKDNKAFRELRDDVLALIVSQPRSKVEERIALISSVKALVNSFDERWRP